MNGTIKKIAALIIILLLLITTSLPTFAAAQHSYSTASNSGIRDEVCTTLEGTGASDYYTGSCTYENLSELSSGALLTALRTLMTNGHNPSSYADCRDYAPKTDCEGNNGKITMIYTSYQGTYAQYSGGSGWNREHVWPKSCGGFETSGAGADLHHIRPSENNTNSQRGNNLYGYVSGGTTSKGNLSGEVGGYYNSSYYEPLDNVKGDVARICLYVYVRWGGEYSKTNNIKNVFQSVDVLLEWCALDPVDTWEMGRNEVVESIQGNRNVFIDYPELAWQLFDREAPSDMVTPSSSGSGSGSGSGNGDTTCSHTVTEIRNAKSATCGVPGYTGDTYCKSCNTKLTSGTSIPKLTNHTFGDWSYDSMTGKEMRICDVCGEAEYKGSDSSCAHSNTEIRDAFPAGCNNNGYSGNEYCLDCGELVKAGESIQYKGHTWGEWASTGDAMTRECKVCKTSQSQIIGECLHSNTERRGVIYESCTADGYNGDKYCVDCNKLLVKGTAIFATGHFFGEVEVITPATKDTEGVGKHTCDLCGAVEETVIPKLTGSGISNPTTTTAVICISLGVLSIGLGIFLKKRLF